VQVISFCFSIAAAILFEATVWGVPFVAYAAGFLFVVSVELSSNCIC
jgi:hypothetical protein